MPNRTVQRAARKLMQLKNIKYTEALRLLTSGKIVFTRNESEFTFEEITHELQTKSSVATPECD